MYEVIVCYVCVCVKFLYVKLMYVKLVCMKLLHVTFVCVCVKFLYVKLLYVVCQGGAWDTESKTRTPHKVVGKKRKLKKTVSDVSVDSHGFPKELATPQKSPPRLWQKKGVETMGKHQASEPVRQGLKATLGLNKDGLKKPAAALKKGSWDIKDCQEELLEKGT